MNLQTSEKFSDKWWGSGLPKKTSTSKQNYMKRMAAQNPTNSGKKIRATLLQNKVNITSMIVSCYLRFEFWSEII